MLEHDCHFIMSDGFENIAEDLWKNRFLTIILSGGVHFEESEMNPDSQ